MGKTWMWMGFAGLLVAACEDATPVSAGGGSLSAGEAGTEADDGGSNPTAASMTTADSNDGSNSDPTNPTDPSESTSPTGPSEPTDPTKTSEADESSGDGSSSTSGAEGEQVVRFIALGDGGEGNDNQYAVADVVEQVCSVRGCEFAIYLGDNFYDVGVDSTMDQQFTDKFEMPYADLDLPFYITLGNHDYGTLGNEWLKSQYQIEYTQFSDKWTLPNEWYAFEAAHVTFISLDTAQLFWDHNFNDQAEFLQGTLAGTSSQYTVAFGHHPYISNGRHGNAGNYEGLGFVPIVNGEHIEEFFDEEVCGKVTMYFSGHDHNRQWHQQNCGTEYIVSGAAAKTTDFENRDDNPTPYYQDDQIPGFAWVEIDGSTMTVAFYDLNDAKTPNYEGSIELGGQ